MTHRLDPLLRPESVAVLGASAREDSMGAWVLENLRRGRFKGQVFPVNPRYKEIDGLVCRTSLRDVIAEFDVNPLIINSAGATAVDALVVGCGQVAVTRD